MAWIYQIKNTKNGKRYIGSSTRYYERWQRHVSDLNNDVHHSWKLQAAWKKYRREEFVFQIVERCLSKANITDREQYWIDKYNSYNRGYNCSALSDRVVIPKKVRTLAARKARKKLSRDAKKQWADPVIRARMLKAMRKADKDPAVRARRSKAMKERVISEEWRERMGIMARNKSPESIAKQSNTMKEKWKDKEYRKKTLAAQHKGLRTPEARLAASIKTKAHFKKNASKYTYKGETKTSAEWAIVLKIKRSRFLGRMEDGLPEEQIYHVGPLKPGRKKGVTYI